MKKLKTYGKYGKGYVFIDGEDFYLIKDKRLYANQWGSVYFNVYKHNKKKTTFLHRFLMKTPIGMDTDHINGNKEDNRRSNLRICTHAQNMRNIKKPITNTSGYKGVKLYNKKYLVTISIKNKNHYFGVYKTPIKAAKVYDKISKKLFGEFTRLNLNKIEG